MREKCTHHWIIESADGRVSKGICNKCGTHKLFENTISEDRSGTWRHRLPYDW